MMAAFPMSAAAAAAAAAGGPCLPSGALCSLPWLCPGQPTADRILQPTIARRDGRLEEIVVPGPSQQMMALHHNSPVGPSPYFPLDSPSLMYSYYLGFGGADVRRKNATRESTSTLKAWLYEHRKNPYPTKGEKIMLAIITKMTLTQVSTWFANARRRLKKENKGEWGLKDSNDPDEDDFEDDIVPEEACPQTASASETSSGRGSPDLPPIASPPSDSDQPMHRSPNYPSARNSSSVFVSGCRRLTTDPGKTSDDERKDKLSDFGEISRRLTNRIGSDKSDTDSGASTSAATSAVGSQSDLTPACTDRLKPSACETNADRNRAEPTESTTDSSRPTAAPAAPSTAPAKRKLWSIDDIVSSAPSERRSPPGFTASARSVPGPIVDRTVPYKYAPYFVDGQRFAREVVAPFGPAHPIFPWMGGRVEADRREARRSFEAISAAEAIAKTYRQGGVVFNRPPSLNGSAFTSQNGGIDYSTQLLVKTESRDVKMDEDKERSTS